MYYITLPIHLSIAQTFSQYKYSLCLLKVTQITQYCEKKQLYILAVIA